MDSCEIDWCWRARSRSRSGSAGAIRLGVLLDEPLPWSSCRRGGWTAPTRRRRRFPRAGRVARGRRGRDIWAAPPARVGTHVGAKRRKMRPNRPPLSPKSAWLSVTPFCGQPGTQLRALWAVWPVEVRVLFGAWKSPAPGGAFFVLGRRAIGRRSAWDQTGLVRAVRCVRQRPRSAARRSRLRRAGRCAGRARSGAAPAAAGLRRSDARAR
jgi:hypothetical protein